MDWDDVKKIVDEADVISGFKYLNLKEDGDSVSVVFCGIPHARLCHWDKTEKCFVFCPGEDGDCEHCFQGDEPRLRVSINVYLKDSGEMMVFEGSTVWFKEVYKAREKYGLDKWYFEIKRHGSSGSRKVFYTVLPDIELPLEKYKEIKMMNLHNLSVE